MYKKEFKNRRNYSNIKNWEIDTKVKKNKGKLLILIMQVNKI